MSVGEYCNREVVVIDKNSSVIDAARLMREYHVGDLVVINNGAMPIGILTDRDIVVELLARDVAVNSVKIGDVMSFKLYTAREGDSLGDTLKHMRSNGIRRIPVINRDEKLVGILTVDDVIDVITEQLDDVVALIGREQKRERQGRQ